MKTKQVLFSSLVLGVAVSFATPAHAASPSQQLVIAAAKSSSAMQEGKRALDRAEYESAREIFAEIAENEPTQAEVALFWQAYAEQQARRYAEALHTIGALQRKYPRGRWADDAEALRAEIRQQRGN